MSDDVHFMIGDYVTTLGDSAPVGKGHIVAISECGRYVKVKKMYGRRCQWKRIYGRDELKLISREENDAAKNLKPKTI